MMKKNYYILGVLSLLYMVLFYFALNLENASVKRYQILLVLFIFQMLLLFSRSFIPNRMLLFILLCISLGINLMLEFQSKYIVNYFFHFFYVLIILEGAYILSFKPSTWISGGAIISSMVKYAYLLSIELSPRNIIEAVFLLLLSGLVMVIIAFSKYYIKEKQKTEALYDELLEVHNQLKNYADKLKELTVVRERNRISRELHDSLGHCMTGLIMQLELAESFLDQDKEKAKDFIIKTKENAREGLKQIRMVVSTLKENEELFNGLISIKELVEKCRQQTSMDITFGILGKERDLEPEKYLVLYRTIQEGLTNAIRHSGATRVDIKITFTDKRIFLYIEDNGKGCNSVRLGNGLKGMKERIESIDGIIQLRSEKGFQIKTEIPFKE